jgi:hypothetical protein
MKTDRAFLTLLVFLLSTLSVVAELYPSAVMASRNSGMYLLMRADGYDGLQSKETDEAGTPEALIFKHFQARKAGSIERILELYQKSELDDVKEKYSDIEKYPAALEAYSDIKLIGKVSIGGMTRFRFDMVGIAAMPFPMVQYAAIENGKWHLTLRGENTGFLSIYGRGHLVNTHPAALTKADAYSDYVDSVRSGGFRAIVFSADAVRDDYGASFSIERDPVKFLNPQDDVGALIVVRFEGTSSLTEADLAAYNQVLSAVIADSKSYTNDVLLKWYSERDQRILGRFQDTMPEILAEINNLFSRCRKFTLRGVVRDSEYVMLGVEIEQDDGDILATVIPFRRKGEALGLFYRDGNDALRVIATQTAFRKAIASLW